MSVTVQHELEKFRRPGVWASLIITGGPADKPQWTLTVKYNDSHAQYSSESLDQVIRGGLGWLEHRLPKPKTTRRIVRRKPR